MLVLCLVLVCCIQANARNLQLLSVQILTRHGARSPYSSIEGLAIPEWNCTFSVFQYPAAAPVSPNTDFSGTLYRKSYIPGRQALPGNCSQGELTNHGALQLQATGTWLRSKLGSFLPATWDQDVMYARSTDVDRTYASAENLLSTLFVPPSRDSIIAKIKRGISLTDAVNIWTIEKGVDDLDVAQNAPCPLLKDQCAKIMSRPAWGVHNRSLAALKKKVAVGLGVPLQNVPDIFLVLEVLRARRAQGIPIPGIDNDTFKAVEDASTWELVQIYNDSLVHKLTSGQILEEMLNVFKDVLYNGSPRKFTLYSAHDTTVAPLVLALGGSLTNWPEYASNVYFGLLKDVDSGQAFVEVLYDRKPLPLSGCQSSGEGYCPFQQFFDIASQSFVKNRDALCKTGKSRVGFDPDPVVDFLC